MPEITLSPLALALAVVLNFMLGYVWYALLFGAAWSRATGVGEHETQGTRLGTALGLNLLCAFLMAFVLANNMGAWTPSSWGLSSPAMPPLEQALSAAGFTWLGFVLPLHLHRFAWEGRKWALLLINAGYGLVALLVAALCLALL